MKASIDRLGRIMRELRVANGANVAVFFALAMVPIIGGVGAAVDYSQANSIKAAMQAAADATVLMLAKNIGSGSLSSTEIAQKANAYFVAMLNRPQAQGVTVTTSYSAAGGSEVTVGATASFKTNLASLLGVSNMQIGVNARAAWGGGSKMQVALALDNTGSMAEWNKIGSLKTATHSLLDQLKKSATNPNDVNVAIIPFSQDVNVSAIASNINAPWIDWSDWDAENGSDVTTKTCTKVVSKKGKSTNKCVGTTTWVPASHTTWNGCVTDRDQAYDVQNTAPNASDKSLPENATSTLFPADQDAGCPVPMIGLTNDWTALNAKVDAMTPNGYTNQAIGLVWAWHALTPGQPMNAPAKGPDVQQVIILLTDGLNTQNRWYDNWVTSQALIDARQKILCDNIKAADITLYTIQVNIGNMGKRSTMLQGCASKPEYFYHLTTAGEIATVFNQIGTNMSQLRLAR